MRAKIKDQRIERPRVRALNSQLIRLLMLGIGCLMGVISPAYAGYNANMTGTVTHVLTYTMGKQILFRLDNQPKHTVCRATYFAIDSSTPADIRHQVLSRLLVAHSSKTPVNIGFDKSGVSGCAHGWIKVYRVG